MALILFMQAMVWMIAIFQAENRLLSRAYSKRKRTATVCFAIPHISPVSNGLRVRWRVDRANFREAEVIVRTWSSWYRFELPFLIQPQDSGRLGAPSGRRIL